LEQPLVRDALATTRLQDDPSAGEIEIHLERFNSLYCTGLTTVLYHLSVSL
jgi:hypothetical protein